MSRIQAAFRHPRQNGIASSDTADLRAGWHGLTRAFESSPRELESLPSEGHDEMVTAPDDPSGSVEPEQRSTLRDEIASDLGLNRDRNLDIELSLDLNDAPFQAVADDDVDRMFEALDRVLTQTPLAGSRRAARPVRAITSRRRSTDA